MTKIIDYTVDRENNTANIEIQRQVRWHGAYETNRYTIRCDGYSARRLIAILEKCETYTVGTRGFVYR
jgi:hypothetical protein